MLVAKPFGLEPAPGDTHVGELGHDGLGACLRQPEIRRGVPGVVGVTANLETNGRIGLENRGNIRELFARLRTKRRRVGFKCDAIELRTTFRGRLVCCPR